MIKGIVSEQNLASFGIFFLQRPCLLQDPNSVFMPVTLSLRQEVLRLLHFPVTLLEHLLGEVIGLVIFGVHQEHTRSQVSTTSLMNAKRLGNYVQMVLIDVKTAGRLISCAMRFREELLCDANQGSKIHAV
ncbi:hypothetical protein P8452_14314 [Trifolium repens]|nr:hypothetical protein P8452_14314 [Trifolium repens]